MKFGITFKGDIGLERTLELCRQAEAGGFEYAWLFDSHVLWQECYTVTAYLMAHTKKLRFGPLVTNPGVRDWTVAASTFASLAKISGNRFDVGVGRGDSSLRMLGKKPRKVSTTIEFMDFVKRMARGETVHIHERDLELPWADSSIDLPMWMAAYGPQALKATGESADGLVLQIGDPWLVEYFAKQAVDAALAAGRKREDLQVMAAAPVWIGDMETCREHTKWFPAMVGNHVADIVAKYGTEHCDIPSCLTEYIQGRKGYNYKEHAKKDADHLGFISNEIVDCFSILGSVEDHIAKLRKLEQAGVDQFCIYLMCGDEERILAEYCEKILPAFSKLEAAR